MQFNRFVRKDRNVGVRKIAGLKIKSPEAFQLQGLNMCLANNYASSRKSTGTTREIPFSTMVIP
jgi:hypothetical protein